MSKKTVALITGLVLLTVLLVVLAVKTSQPSQVAQTPTPDTTTKPSIATQAKTKLYLDPNPVSLIGNNATVNVMMDSADNEITAVQVELSYDPKVLSFVSITPSTVFAQSIPLLKIIDKKNGRISYALGLTPEQAKTAHTGKSEVATVVFTKLAASGSATTPITFLPKSLVSARGVNQSVLKETQGTTITLSPSAK